MAVSPGPGPVPGAMDKPTPSPEAVARTVARLSEEYFEKTGSTVAPDGRIVAKAARKPTAKQKKIDDARVTRAYGRVAHGVQVPIMSTVAIMKAGQDAIAAGADDATLDAAVLAAVKKVRIA